MSQPQPLKKLLIAYGRFPPIAPDLKKAFERSGIEVEVFDTVDYEHHWFYRRVIRVINRYARSLRLIPRGGDLFAQHPFNLRNFVGSNFQRVSEKFQPDALFVIHGLDFAAPYISSMKIPKVGWHLEPNDDLDYITKNAKPFNVYNSFSLNAVDLLIAAGFDGRYLSHSVDTARFFPIPNLEKSIDLSFVGNWSPWREEVLRAVLKVTKNVCLYGDQWHRKCSIDTKLLRSIYKAKKIVGPELNDLLSRSKVVLNASRIKASHGLNMRFFEVLATDSVLLTDEVTEIDRHFEPDVDLVVYADTTQLQQKLQMLLASPELRQRISAAGYQKVMSHYTYGAMAAQLMAQFESLARSA
jgi:glycosyltransferase involved in cell wall biosynthesis